VPLALCISAVRKSLRTKGPPSVTLKAMYLHLSPGAFFGM
jgi:hypothetical protein